MKDIVRALNESIVSFSELQDLIEDFQMDVEDKGTIETIFQIPYSLSVYKEIEKIKPILLWKGALAFIDYMDQNYDEIIHKVSTNYDTKMLPYKQITMMKHNSYQELREVIKQESLEPLTLSTKSVHLKRFISFSIILKIINMSV